MSDPIDTIKVIVGYRGLKADIEAEVGDAAIEPQRLAWATDTSELGIWTDSGWEWIAQASAAALDDLSDVTISGVATGDMLRYSGSAWVNVVGRWEPVTTNPGTGPELVWDGDDIVMNWNPS